MTLMHHCATISLHSSYEAEEEQVVTTATAPIAPDNITSQPDATSTDDSATESLANALVNVDTTSEPKGDSSTAALALGLVPTTTLPTYGPPGSDSEFRIQG
ncbi:uncharacterized protein KY384_004666 [Bacidia gigantensis]|uniref:uncharacterized protein n=1 Tax=Bacidia gigantensis TaxID=2732470 RepID=UPI001D0414BF|nr:uncharacterized protein KY384_004666 [Bacidia gigantensis]KAG8530628.1 hypothetical protein KY384_004666 [Bacidia gigantensis]